MMKEYAGTYKLCNNEDTETILKKTHQMSIYIYNTPCRRYCLLKKQEHIYLNNVGCQEMLMINMFAEKKYECIR